MPATLTTLLANLGEASNRTLVLPLVAFFPTSRCNSRCCSCDWWQSTGADDLSFAEIGSLADGLAHVGTILVAFTGGEPLLRPDVFEIARLFRQRGMSLHLLTSGLALNSRTDQVALWFERVIVSLDAATRADYLRIRGIDAFDQVLAGVRRLAQFFPLTPVHARATLHKLNFRALPALIDAAHEAGFRSISFLAADVQSEAFGRTHGKAVGDLLLDRKEISEFREVIARCEESHADAFSSGFVAEQPDGLRRLPQHYAAMLGDAPFPPVACNAPWVSAVIEANGDVRPCFFHRAVGNVRDVPLSVIVRRNLRAFRSTLEVATNDVCQRCVCSLKTGWRHHPWR